jgi:hypothetical protein
MNAPPAWYIHQIECVRKYHSWILYLWDDDPTEKFKRWSNANLRRWIHPGVVAWSNGQTPIRAGKYKSWQYVPALPTYWPPQIVPATAPCPFCKQLIEASLDPGDKWYGGYCKYPHDNISWPYTPRKELPPIPPNVYKEWSILCVDFPNYDSTSKREWQKWHQKDTPEQKKAERSTDEPEEDDYWIIQALQQFDSWIPKTEPAGKKIKKSDEYYHGIPRVWQSYPAHIWGFCGPAEFGDLFKRVIRSMIGRNDETSRSRRLIACIIDHPGLGFNELDRMLKFPLGTSR